MSLRLPLVLLICSTGNVYGATGCIFDFTALTQVKNQWRGIGVTLVINWFVKPFSMALLGWIFIHHLFPLASDRSIGQLCSGTGLACRSPMYRDGFCLEPAMQR
jgi:hypothetical protein